MIPQATGVGQMTVSLPGGEQIVPWVRLDVGNGLIGGQMQFEGRTFYPSRFRVNGDENFLAKSVSEVLKNLRGEPLVIVEGGGDSEEQSLLPVAVYYAPGPGVVPMSSVELVAT